MLFQELLVGLVLVSSFLVTFLSTPVISRALVKAGIIGRDMHKKEKPILAEMGALSLAFGVVLSLCVAVGLSKNVLPLEVILAALSSILIIVVIGISDDIFQLPQAVKATLPFLAALPLMAIREGVRTMSIPILGPVDFGILYPLVLIPIGITGAANAANILAGLNGLEAGLGLIMHGTILLVSLAIMPLSPHAINSAVISGALVGGLLAFLYFNKFPAKVFPGDVGTLLIGGAFGASVILGNMEKIGLILIFPYFIELFLKARTRFKGSSFGILQKDGTLKAPAGFPSSLTHVAMRIGGTLTEAQVVGLLLAMEFIFALLAGLSVYLQYF